MRGKNPWIGRDLSAARLSFQLIPQISSLSWFTTIVPLVLVLTITAVKDATDDYVSCHPHRSRLQGEFPGCSELL